jgi:Domain of unknown function (DUF4389)
MEPHPIRIVVEDDLARSRLTVFFRLLLGIPHFIWLTLWGIVVFLVAILSWFVVLILGRLPAALHRFQAAYVRYWTHFLAFLNLTANPFPGFTGQPGSYPVDVEIDDPERQSRLKTFFRGLLAIPALMVAALLAGDPTPVPGGGWGEGDDVSTGELIWILTPAPSFGGFAIGVAAFLTWFAALALARSPQGFRDLGVYALRYGAQVGGFLLFLTDRYPNSNPVQPAAPEPPPVKPIRMRVEDDLRRSRLTVFFRLLLAIPHFIWLTLWGIAAYVAAIVNWLVTLIAGKSPNALHRFLAAFVRYQAHVYAYLFLIANPFPGFTGTEGTYPVDLEIDPPERQNRWKTLFRSILALPAFLLAYPLSLLVGFVALFLWFCGLFLGRAPEGLRNLGAYVLRYFAQTYGYFYLLTDRYPYSGPLEYVEPEPEPEPEVVPTWPDAPPEPSF